MLRSIVSSIEFEKFRRNWSEKNSAQRFPELSVSASRVARQVALTQRLASIGARQVVSHFNYEICELRRRPGKLSERLPMGRRSGSRCIEFIIRPNFLTSNSR
ncbi:hypothetical protein [Leptospira noguchii]|uniref:hypothetical protein n=1 Tax=Leptospira noguchii TaxID=28182 RepID=UPI001FB7C44A|nr:hypothetical protein [Leptospira noguchii]UOG52432.1 hypothetical protein MAL09_17990 [Leptospira noguchii]